jgi:hypothetical protein
VGQRFLPELSGGSFADLEAFDIKPAGERRCYRLGVFNPQEIWQ